MTPASVDPEREVAKIFNSAIAAGAIASGWEIGLLTELKNDRRVNTERFASKHDLHVGSVQGLVTALITVHVVEREPGLGLDLDHIVPGKLFDEAYRTKSLFHWLSLGSGDLFSRMPSVLRNENRVGDFYTRDAAAIAYACRDINSQYWDPAFWAAMDGLDFSFSSVVDLGCGSGGRLMQILNRYPGVTGLGIDIAVPAIKVAAADGNELGLDGKLSFLQDDVRELKYRDEFAEAELVTCFLMGHDFWPRENCVKTLRRLRESFPKSRRFLLGDTFRGLLDSGNSKYAVKEDDVPIFTLGFELGHALMDVCLPTIEDWEGVFAEGGWRCVRKHFTESLALSVVFVLEHA
ncbi:methyltransferase MppJ [Rhexocercosporidium sp. MPI-PUGE-AT-0058]|nr:methyltransferase MppJ [Rhexocercosporidium sp. MPI-PUGE-AT-0058]